jgi:uncharacterized phage-associated protein
MSEERIRFTFNPEKALEALVWVARQWSDISFYYMVKVLYYADKEHLNRFGRPILGDRYIAMEHGPVPSVVYDMLGRDSFLEPDLIAKIEASLEFGTGRPPTLRAKRDADMRFFSRTDIECLQNAVSRFSRMTVSRLRALTHQEAAYAAATLNGELDYALMVEGPDRDRRLADIRETARAVAI